MRYNRRNIDLDRLTAFKRNLHRRRNIDLDRLTAFRRNAPKQEIDLDRLTAFRRNAPKQEIDLDRLTAFRRNAPKQEIDLDRLTSFNRFKNPSRLSAIRHRDYIQPLLRRNPAPDGSAWGPQLYNPLQDDKHQFKDDSHYKKIASKLRRNPFRFNPEEDSASEVLEYYRNPGCTDCEESECVCVKEYRYNPLPCDSCEQHICSCTKSSSLMRRRSNPSNACNDCGLRFGLHARACNRRNW